MHFLSKLLIISFLVLFETAFVKGQEQTSDEICHCHDSVLNRMIIKKSGQLVYDASGIISIHAKTKWKKPKIVFGTLVVDSGAELIISGKGAIIQFADSKHSKQITRIIVKPGGKLVIGNHAKFTALLHCPHTMWDGIEVHGNPVASQNPFSNQGYVEMSGDAVIEHARYAIMLGKSRRNDKGDVEPHNSQNITDFLGGGVVRMNDAEIRNCLYGLWFSPYLYTGNNRSIIANSRFMTNQLTRDRTYLNDEPGSDYRRIAMRAFSVQRLVRRIKYYGNTFTVDNSTMNLQPDLLGTGIQAGDGSYIVENINAFTGLYTGIDSRYSLPFTQYYSRVQNNTFDGVYRGIYGEGCSWQNIFDNTFENIPTGGNYSGKDVQPFGLWMNYPQGIRATGNTFTGVQKLYNRGAAITNSLGFHARILNSSFTDLMTGTQAEGLNNTLRIYCNGYTNHDQAWAVLKDINGQGFLPNQGTGCQQNQIQAGNIFNDGSCQGSNTECHIFSEVNFHYWGNTSPSGAMPIYYNSMIVGGTNCPNANGNCPFQRIELNDSTAADYRREMEEITDSLMRLEMAYHLIDYYADKDTLNSDTVLVNIFRFIDDNNLNKHLAALYLSRNELDSAEAVMKSLHLTGAEDSTFYTLLNLYLELAQQDKSLFEMDGEQQQTLLNLSELPVSAGRFAETALEITTGRKHEHTLMDVPPKEERRSTPAEEKEPEKQEILCKLKAIPNPSAGLTYAVYEVEGEPAAYRICIYNLQGSQLQCMDIKQNKGMMAIHYDQLSSGTYLLQIERGGKRQKAIRLMVTK